MRFVSANSSLCSSYFLVAWATAPKLSIKALVAAATAIVIAPIATTASAAVFIQPPSRKFRTTFTALLATSAAVPLTVAIISAVFAATAFKVH